MVADLYQWWYRRLGRPTDRLFIPCFAINEPFWTLRTGSVPFWIFFNEETALARVNAYLDTAEPYNEIILTLVQNAVKSIGQPTPAEWRTVLDRARVSGRYAGTDLDEFPFDLAQMGTYDDALKDVDARFPLPEPLTMAEFEEFLEQAPDYPGVQWLRE